MARKSPLIDSDAPVLTEAELREMRPARNVLTAEEFAAVSSVRKAGRPVAPNPKVPVTIRLDPATVDAFKATGRGWQTRMNAILTEAVKAGRHDG
ncbi:BrnA antitoxin family protein [Methylobacterium sp. E-005]|uniref:BrnA antitoxin family protein n=1 Tax=Methylobacterium sp. E-005 TaxID=2836549 RepID=UPI001FBBA2E6|nr:BrnA antitoxin family protein [Methylobacterium sp. E-005]MCJ2087925.1 BrnA antitoxin family protein [Methylobacterium sp. E-005]